MKLTRETFTKARLPVPAQIGIAVVVIGGLVFGTVGTATAIQNARAEQQARTVAAAEDAREQAATEKAMYAAAEDAKAAQDAADEAAYQQFLADKAAAEAKAAADAKAAEDARIAAEAQAAADAAAKAATKAPVKSSSSAGGSAGVHGKKVPFIPSDDPQNADGGSWDMSVCQGGSASTGADGTPYCD